MITRYSPQWVGALEAADVGHTLWLEPDTDPPAGWAHLTPLVAFYSNDETGARCDRCGGPIKAHTWRVVTATTALACSGLAVS